MKTSLKTYVTFLIDKITLFFSLTLLIIVCAVYFGDQENTEKITEFINSNSYANKAMQVDSLTEFEFERIESLLSDFYNSSVYKSAGQVELNKAYFNHDFQHTGPLYYFNTEYYKKISSDKNEKNKLYAKVSEYKLGEYVTSGIKIYSTDKDFKDDSKIILVFPYLRVNPRLKTTNIIVRGKDNFLSTDMQIDLNISSLEEVEKEALKKTNFSSFHIAKFEGENMYISVYLSNYRAIEESKITKIN